MIREKDILNAMTAEGLKRWVSTRMDDNLISEEMYEELAKEYNIVYTIYCTKKGFLSSISVDKILKDNPKQYPYSTAADAIMLFHGSSFFTD